MTIIELFKKIDVSITQKNKLIKRYQKMGIEVIDMEISEADANRVLNDFSESVNLSEFVETAMNDVDVNAIRATLDIRTRLSSEGVPIKKFSDTTFSVTPNTYYVCKDFLSDLNRVIDEYRNSITNGETFQMKVKQEKRNEIKPVNLIEQKELEQKENLVGIVDYLRMHPGWEIYSRKINHRENALIFIEDHGWFGLKYVLAKEIIFEKTRNNPYYIQRSDIPIWDKYMRRFFEEYGLNGDQLLSKIVNGSERKYTMKKFEKFLNENNKDMRQIENKTTLPHVSDVAWILSESDKELNELTTPEVTELLRSVSTIEGKNLFMMFMGWMKAKEEVAYEKILPVEKKHSKIKGYSMEEYIGFCHLFFFEEHIEKAKMVKKALDDIRNAGMWMYHSVLAIMDLRGVDIESIVKFPDILSDCNWLKDIPRDAKQLESAILLNNISEKTYINVGRWFVDGFTYNEVPVHKTNLGEVIGRITPELLAHFGKLFLIGEVHHLRGEKRFLDISKWGSNTYCKRIFMANFYGEEIYRVLGRSNFQRVKMNHAVSQMEEKTAHDMGMDSYTAVTIASYSRGHTNIATMFHYIGDHSLTGENAEVVLWLMLQRKVLSVVPYLTLLTYYPESFGKLSAKEQTEMIELSGLSPADIEVIIKFKNQVIHFGDAMVMGDVEDPITILKTLLAIGQGYGASMDKGGYCLKRAMGYKCTKETRGRCLTSGCKYEVLTAEVIPTMVELIVENTKRAKEGDAKAYALLKSNLHPNFVKVRHYLKNALSEEVFNYIDDNMKLALGVTQ